MQVRRPATGLAALHPRKGPWWGQADGGSGGPGLAFPGQHPTALQLPKPAGRANPRFQRARLGDRRLLLEADQFKAISAICLRKTGGP